MKSALAVLGLAVVLTSQSRPVHTQQHPVAQQNPEPELGLVNWERDFDAALARAEREKKPVFLLFSELPGCATCTGFGSEVLSHKLLVAAIEACFVPVAIRNNVEGKEKAVLARYGEPAWNNPVVRLLDAKGKDLIARKDRIWDVHGNAERMIAALEKVSAPIPGYLRIAADESDPRTEKAVFEMHCFWEGEALFGVLPGVVATRAAFVGAAEVVEVTFLPAVVTRRRLTDHAQAKSCKVVVSEGLREAPTSDQKHALIGTPFEQLDLTPMQRMRVHSALTQGGDPAQWLTARQAAAVRSK